MYWTISIIISVILTIIFWSMLSRRWRNLVSGTNDILSREYVQVISIFASKYNLPGMTGYMDLKFSLLRHAIVFALFAVILYFAKVKWLETITTFFFLLYTFNAIIRYRRRVKVLNIVYSQEEPHVFTLCKNTVKNSSLVMWYSIIATIALYILLLVKP